MPVIINGSTGISGNDGTAAVPTIQGTDANTGMFFPAADTIAFAEGGVEAARLTSGGELLVGTTAVAASDWFTTTPVGVFSANNNAQLRVHRPSTGDGVGAGALLFAASDGSGNQRDIAVVRCETTAVNAGGGALAFFTRPNSGSLTERARITSAGNFGIGTASPNSMLDVRGSAIISTNTNVPGTTGWQGAAINGTVGSLEISRNGSNVAAFYHTSNAGGTGGSPVGTISITTTNTSYNTSSDYRLKENVVPLTDAATRLGALKPSRFNFISDPSRTFDGFLAHEAAEVVPEAVTGEKDEVNEDGKPVYQGIDHSKLVPLLTAALQEALTEIAALKARVAALEAR